MFLQEKLWRGNLYCPWQCKLWYFIFILCTYCDVQISWSLYLHLYDMKWKRRDRWLGDHFSKSVLCNKNLVLCFADHASQYNLSNLPTYCTNSCFIITLLYSSTCFEHYMLIIRRSKLYYTASGIITPIGGCPVHWLRVCARDSRLQVWWYQMLYNTILTSWWWAYSAQNM